MNTLITKLTEKWNKASFNRTLRKVRHTAPLQYSKDDKITVVSMVGHQTLEMYLVAVKSFMNNFGNANIEAIDDGSLTEEDRATLSHHVPGIAFSMAAEIDTHGCPTYISWRRLFRIIAISQHSYVIQLDSDIVALSPLVEVYRKAAANEGFMIAEGTWRELVDTKFMSAIAKRWPWRHPQAMAEQIFDELPEFSGDQRYLRGCAGFAGYPQGSLSIERVKALSDAIEAKISRPVWERWGSEQTATNALISLSNNPEVLPWPRYQNHGFPYNYESQGAAALIHFIGSTRFFDTTYRDLVKLFCKNETSQYED